MIFSHSLISKDKLNQLKENKLLFFFFNKNFQLITNITLTPSGYAKGLAFSANKSLLFIANYYNMHIYNVTIPQVKRKNKINKMNNLSFSN